MKIKFFKMNGSGNDFVLIDNRESLINPDDANLSKISRFLCNRNISIGADGVLYLEESKELDFIMRLFQPDGSEAEMCGNGARCIAKFAVLNGIVREKKMKFGTKSGEISAEIIGDEVKVALPQPRDLRLNLAVSVGNGHKVVGDFLNTGVPHYTVFCRDFKEYDIAEIGRKIRCDKIFAPAGTNVNFYRVDGETAIFNRTYERGVEDETLACGTGSTASAIISGIRGYAHSPVKVRTKSGLILTVYFDLAGSTVKNVFLQGDARVSFVGEIEIDKVE